MPEAELDSLTLERARRGERRAQDEFVRRYAAPLFHLLRRSGVVQRDVEDATQELLTKVVSALPQFDPLGPASLSTWVFTIANRYVIDLSRKRHLQTVELDAAKHVEDSAPSAHRGVEQHQARMALESALQELPVARRRVFVLVHVHGQSLEAVAEAEGVPVGTVKSRLHRARAELAEKLTPEWRSKGERLESRG